MKCCNKCKAPFLHDFLIENMKSCPYCDSIFLSSTEKDLLKKPENINQSSIRESTTIQDGQGLYTSTKKLPVGKRLNYEEIKKNKKYYKLIK